MKNVQERKSLCKQTSKWGCSNIASNSIVEHDRFTKGEKEVGLPTDFQTKDKRR